MPPAHDPMPDCAAALRNAGLAPADIERWCACRPQAGAELEVERARFGEFWRMGTALLARLPAKPRRNALEAQAARALNALAREAREAFLGAHAVAVYDELSAARSRALRVEDLCYAAAEAFPGLVPTRAEVDAQSGFLQRDKDGIEIDQGIFCAHLLSHPDCGRHLLQSMLLPRPESLALAREFAQSGVAEFAGARIERRGRAAQVTIRNPRFLNAEDDTTLAGQETAVDLALLDEESEIGVLRGARVDHPKYSGRRIFGAGINLTHIYQGRIPYLWYLTRDLGLVNKLYRGLARGAAGEVELSGDSIEKPWIAAVETFAIGGHCQILLAVDYTLAAEDAYLTLPARKEGIIPGAANLRLPRFTGDRLARQAILFERRFECASAEGRLICDRIVPPGDMDAAIQDVVQGLTSSGIVSAAGNRRALRVAQEPLDEFRRYMAVYAREQALCHFSPALIDNLERHWDAKNRKA